MKVAATEGDIATLRTAFPCEPIMWVRPDKHIEVHPPHGKPKKVYPPRPNDMR
jgi:hypothetical protein